MMSSHTTTLEALTENKSRLVMNELLSLVAGTVCLRSSLSAYSFAVGLSGQLFDLWGHRGIAAWSAAAGSLTQERRGHGASRRRRPADMPLPPAAPRRRVQRTTPAADAVRVLDDDVVARRVIPKVISKPRQALGMQDRDEASCPADGNRGSTRGPPDTSIPLSRCTTSIRRGRRAAARHKHRRRRRTARPCSGERRRACWRD